jgi:hypothetical protein
LRASTIGNNSCFGGSEPQPYADLGQPRGRFENRYQVWSVGRTIRSAESRTEIPVKGGNMGRLVMALCVLSMVASAQEDPLAWFPLRAGNRWVYEHEWKSGDRNQPDVDRWTTEETITGWVTIPEGLVVLREVKQKGTATEQTITRRVIAANGQLRYVQQQQGNTHGALIARDREPYLVHGNCIYAMGAGWDGQMQELRLEYRKYLSEGAVSADFCFPLLMGGEWGNNDIPWRFEPAREGVGAFLPAEYAGAIHIFSSHFGSGGLEDVWFQKGIGIVGEHYLHNGTYNEYTKKLLSLH